MCTGWSPGEQTRRDPARPDRGRRRQRSSHRRHAAQGSNPRWQGEIHGSARLGDEGTEGLRASRRVARRTAERAERPRSLVALRTPPTQASRGAARRAPTSADDAGDWAGEVSPVGAYRRDGAAWEPCLEPGDGGATWRARLLKVVRTCLLRPAASTFRRPPSSPARRRKARPPSGLPRRRRRATHRPGPRRALQGALRLDRSRAPRPDGRRALH